MAWLPDEQYVLMTDTRDKSITARSARRTRTHAGKSGAVKFPSDYLSTKELKAMSGECIKYASLKKPMTWNEFKALPDDLKKVYIKSLRDKYNVPGTELAEMFGVSQFTVSKCLETLGLGVGKNGRKRTWDREGFLAWRSGAPEAVAPSETPIEEVDVVEEIDLSRADQVFNEEDAQTNMVKPEIPKLDSCNDIELVEGPAMINRTIGDLLGDSINNAVEGGHSMCCSEVKHVVPLYGEMSFEGNVDDILRTVSHLLAGTNVRLSVKWDVLEG